MKIKYYRYCLLIFLLVILAVFAGCGEGNQSASEAVYDFTNEEEMPDEADDEEVEEEVYYEDITVEVNGTVVTFEDITTDGALIVGDEMVIQTMIIKEDIPEEHVVKLAEEIAQYLREEYPDLIVTILADRVTGEEIIHITLE